MEDPEELETVTVARRVIVSYDVRKGRRTEASMIQQFVFGRDVWVKTKGGRKRYRYEGLVQRPGVERVGQSVLLLREKDAEDLTSYLSKLRVPYYRERVWVEA